MAEHMLIMGIEDPSGHISYIAAAFPAPAARPIWRCLLPPEGLKKERLPDLDRRRRYRLDADRYRRRFVGGQSGDRVLRRRAGNEFQNQPEHDGRPSDRNTIYTNVLLKQDELFGGRGDGEPPTRRGDRLAGQALETGMTDRTENRSWAPMPTAALPLPIAQCPSVTIPVGTAITACRSRR